MTRRQSCVSVLVAGLVICAAPGWATTEAPAPVADGPEVALAEGTARPADAPVEQESSTQPATDTDFTQTFRLFSRRDIDLRLRPDVGLRVRPMRPLFSPHTADFHGREREQGSATHFSGSISVSLLSADGERDSFKGQEFRDLSEEASVGVDFQLRNQDDWFRLTGRHLTLDDRDLELEWRRLGVAKTRLFYNRIPHRFALDARSLYAGINSGRLTLDDEIQQTLQDSPNLVEGAALLAGFAADAALVDIGLARDRLSLEFDLTAFHPLAIEVTVDQESRDGARAWSGSFGLSSFVEIPWPVDYDTRNLKVGLEYQKGPTLVRGSYLLSTFDNNISEVVFDNPWRLTDSAQVGPVNVFGPATGLIDLYPDNEQQELTLTAVRNELPGDSSLQATLAWNRMEQDDSLVPFTTNRALVDGGPFGLTFNFSDPAALPATRADAQLDSQLVHLRWISRPTDAVTLKAHYRDYEMDNETEQVFISGFGIEDTFFRPFPVPGGGAFTNLPIAFHQTSYGLEAGFRLGAGTKLTLSYENEEIERKFREVKDSTEDRYKVSIDSKPSAWADLRLSYTLAERDIGNYDFAQFFASQGIETLPVLPFLLKFDQAARDRDRTQLMANFYIGESLVIGAQAIVGSDEYPDSAFGVLEDEQQMYAVDLSYLASERLSLFASYGLDKYDILLRGRQWLPFGAGDPFRVETGIDSASNWTANSIDEIDTASLGLEIYAIPDKLRFGLSYTYSKSDGEIRYASPIGDLDQNPFDPVAFQEVDDVTWYSFNPELEYSINDRLTLAAAYLRESYEILDFAATGFSFVPVTPAGEFNGGLLMGTLPKDFEIDVVSLRLEVSF